MIAPTQVRERLRRCLGFGPFTGTCVSPADSRRTPYWCQRCDDLRCEHISESLRGLVAAMEGRVPGGEGGPP